MDISLKLPLATTVGAAAHIVEQNLMTLVNFFDRFHEINRERRFNGGILAAKLGSRPSPPGQFLPSGPTDPRRFGWPQED
jgi:hypothetical protein